MRKALLHSLAVLIATITFGLQESSAQTILSSINPASALQGQMVTVTFRGKNFTQNATVTITPPTGVIIGAVNFSNPARFTVPFTINGAATPGVRTVTVNGSASLSFRIKAGVGGLPTLTDITPAHTGRNVTKSVTLTGTNFSPDATVVTPTGTGLTISQIGFVDASHLTATVTTTAGADSGDHAVKVVTGSGTSSALPITVDLPPTLTSIAPVGGSAGSTANGPSGTTVKVNINGTNFVSGVGNTALALVGTGCNVLTIGSVTVMSPTTLQTTFTSPSNTSPTNCGIKITTPGGNVTALTFAVTAPLTNLTLFDSTGASISEIAVNRTNGNTVQADIRGLTSNVQQPGVVISYTQTDNTDVATINQQTGVITPGVKAGFTTFTASAGGAAPLTVLIDVVDVSTAASSSDVVVGVAQDTAGSLYLASSSANKVLVTQTLGQTPVPYAGNGQTTPITNGPKLTATFNNPSFLAIDQSRSLLYVSDSNNNVIRKIDGTSGQVQTLVLSQNPTLSNPQGIALDNRGFLWVVDSGTNTIRKIDLGSFAATIVAGDAVAGQPGDPSPTTVSGSQARFRSPVGIALEPDAAITDAQVFYSGFDKPALHMLVADGANGVIRRITENNDGSVQVDTLASTGGASATRLDSGKTVSPISAIPFNSPSGIAVDSQGNIFVTEPGSGRIKTILKSSSAVVDAVQPTTLAAPRGLALGGNGRILVGPASGSVRQIQFGQPTIDPNGISPASVPASGCTGNPGCVTIHGSNFEPGTIVILGGAPVSNLIIQNTKMLTFDTPHLPSGLTTLSIQNRGGFVQAKYLLLPTPLSSTSPGNVTTVAGGSTYVGDGGLANEPSVSLYRPAGIVVDTAGNIFFADQTNHRIRRIDIVSGIITTIAGNGAATHAGDGGPATAAALSFPTGIAFDSAGNLFIADELNNRIRKVTVSTGIISLFAGKAAGAYSEGGYGFENNPEEDVDAVGAGIYHPYGVALDLSNNVFIADTGNNRIRRVDAVTHKIKTYAGSGSGVYAGDNGPATSAGLRAPMAIAVDSTGVLYIAEPGRIRKVATDANHTITTIAGTGSSNCTVEGSAGSAFLSDPRSVTIDNTGKLLIVDFGCLKVWKLDPGNGNLTKIAGSGMLAVGSDNGDNGQALNAKFANPWGAGIDGWGNTYITDFYGQRIRKVTTATGVITTIAGNGETRFYGDNGQAGAAALNSPQDVTVDPLGNLYIMDSSNNRLRKVDTNGIITTIAGNGGAGNDGPAQPPSGIPGAANSAHINLEGGIAAAPNGDVFFVESGVYVRKVSGGVITNYAGNGNNGSSGDGGPATEASFGAPGVNNKAALALDSLGNLYITDTATYRIRKVDAATGIINTIAGTGAPGFSPDGTLAVSAQIGYPTGVAVDSFGNVFFADRDNRLIRKIDVSTGVLSSILPTFDDLRHIAIDASNNLFLIDGFWIRKIPASSGILPAGTGVPATFVTLGGGNSSFSGDDGPSNAAGFHMFYPTEAPGISLDAQGNLYIADAGNQRIRAIKRPANVPAPGSDIPLSVSISEPQVNATVAGIVRISASVSPTVGILGVQFKDGNNNIGAEDTSAPYTVNWNATGATLGAHTIIATVRTANATASNSITVFVSTLSVSIVWPMPNATLSGTTVIQAVAGTSNTSIADVTFKLDGVVLGVDSTQPYSLAWNTSSTNNGVHTLTAVVRDAGNNQTTSAPVSVIVDNVPAATWVKQFGGSSSDDGTSTVADSTGVYVAGKIGQHAFLSKYTFHGKLVWTQSVSFNGVADSYDIINSLSADGSGIYAAGTVQGSGAGQNFIQKYDASNGNPIWSQVLVFRCYNFAPGIESITGITADSTGTYFTGFDQPLSGHQQFFVGSVSAAGAVNCFSSLPASFAFADYAGKGIAVDPNGVYVGGDTNVGGASRDGFLAKFTKNGGYTGVIQFGTQSLGGSPLDDYINTVAVDSTGIYVGGQNIEHTFINNFSFDSKNGLLWKFPLTGSSPIWTKQQINGGYLNENNIVGLAADGASVYASGWVSNSNGIKAVIQRYDSSGNLHWSQPYGTSGMDYGKGIALHPTGLYVAGTTNGTFPGQANAGSDDAYLARFGDVVVPAITTIVGSGPLASSSPDGTLATSAKINFPTFATTDAAGTLYFSEASGNLIRKLNADGTISTVVNTASNPHGLVFDSSGNLYFSDAGHGKVSKRTPAGAISDIATQLNTPTGLAIEASGNILVAEFNGHRVLRIALNNNNAVTPVAGTGAPGTGAEGVLGPASALNNPYDVAVDRAGNIYISDRSNNRIRKVDTSNHINTIAGTGAVGFGGDGGPPINAQFNQPAGLALDGAGNLYIADQQNHRVRKIIGNVITTIAGTGVNGYGGDTGPALSGILNAPNDVHVDSAGNLYIVEYSGLRIRKVVTPPPTLTITTFAGTGGIGYSGDNGQAINALLRNPSFAVTDKSGNVYFSDGANHVVRKVTPDGIITTFAGNGSQTYNGDNIPAQSASLSLPGGLVFDSLGNLYIADYGHNRIRKVTPDPDRTISTIAGNGTQGFLGLGGLATSAQLNGPTGLAIDSAGTLYIAEYGNNRVVKVTNNTISKIAGSDTGVSNFSGDNGPATNSLLSNPYDVAVDKDLNIYVSDRGNNRIRKIDAATLNINTIAGKTINGVSANFSGDGGLAVNAQLNQPCGIALDSSGNLYIADLINQRVRKITAGVITTITGTGTADYGGDDGPASSGVLNYPNGVTVDSLGNIYIAEYSGYRVRKVSAAPTLP